MPNNENLRELLKESIKTQKKILLKKASKDPVFFINNFLWTFNPRAKPYHFPFHLFPFQYELVYELVDAIENGHDIFIEKCREMGATYTVLAVLFWFWRFVPGSNFLVGSRKEDYVDNTKGDSEELSNKEESLFGKLEYFINRLDKTALPAGFIQKKHLNYMSLMNPENGNSISGESSNPNFSRGARQKAVMLDEFAFWDNDSAVWGATADTTSCRIVLTTPGIRPSKAKRLRQGKDGENIKVITLGHNLDPRKTEEWVAYEKGRRSAEDFAREIMINWEGSIEGRVYHEIKMAEIGDFPYDPAWPLFYAWDFGLDGTSIGAWQINPANGKLRLVDSYENIDHPIQFFFPLVGQPLDSMYAYTDDDLDAFLDFAIYKKPVHYGDPDVAKRSYQSKDAKSTTRVLSDIGVYVQTKPESNDFATRRERTKVWLQRGIEINKNKRTDQFIEAIQYARYPQRDEQSQSTGPVRLPIHDWTSHYRTMLEYLCVNLEMPERLTHTPVDPQEIIRMSIARQDDKYDDGIMD